MSTFTSDHLGLSKTIKVGLLILFIISLLANIVLGSLIWGRVKADQDRQIESCPVQATPTLVPSPTPTPTPEETATRSRGSGSDSNVPADTVVPAENVVPPPPPPAD